MATATSFLKVTNRASGLLDSDVDNSSDPVVVALGTGEGALFPATGNFDITIDSEILRCTSRTGDDLTCSRAVQGTTIAAHSTSATVQIRTTAQLITDLNNAINAIELGTKTLDKSVADGAVPQYHANRVTLTGDKAEYRATSWNAFGGVALYRKGTTDTRKKWTVGTEDATGQDPDLVFLSWTGAGGGESSTEILRILNAGGVRLTNNLWIVGRNAANSANVNIVKLNTSDQIEFGANVNAATFELQNTTALKGKATATSLVVAGHVTGGAAAQRDISVQTGNAVNPQALVERLKFGSNAAQGSAPIVTFEDIVPNTDNISDLGSASKRWAEAHINALTTGDLGFTETLCAHCGKVLEGGQKVALLVVQALAEGTYTIPIHLECPNV